MADLIWVHIADEKERELLNRDAIAYTRRDFDGKSTVFELVSGKSIHVEETPEQILGHPKSD
jgi:hypothetical protein